MLFAHEKRNVILISQLTQKLYEPQVTDICQCYSIRSYAISLTIIKVLYIHM